MERMRPQHMMAGIAGVIVFIAAFLPWATSDIGPASASASGIDGDGAITLTMALIALGGAGISLVRHRSGWTLTLAMGLLIALIGVIDMANVGGNDGMSIGAGLVLTALGGIALALVGGAALRLGDPGRAVP